LKNSAIISRRKRHPPAAPAHLTEESRGWWDRIQADSDITDPPGLLLLQSALEALDRMRQAQAAIAVDGLTVHDRFGQPKVHPATVTERDSRAAMLSALKSLNLDIEPPSGAR